jgi:hypothetical protein
MKKLILPLEPFYDPDLNSGVISQLSDSQDVGAIKGFIYPFDIAEIDISYVEYIPRAALITKPFNPPGEVRRIWVNSVYEGTQSGVTYKIFPFADNRGEDIEVTPFSTTFPAFGRAKYSADGDVCEIITREEYNSGLYNPSSSIKQVIVEPKKVTDNINGTDEKGELKLTQVPHIRRARVRALQNWLRDKAIHNLEFDPNSAVVFGISDSSILSSLKSYTNNDSSVSTISASSIVSTGGYLPVLVTLKTNNFTAYPDRVGKPDSTIVRTITGEILSQSIIEVQERDIQEQVMSFDEWTATVYLDEFSYRGVWVYGNSANPPKDRKLVQDFLTSSEGSSEVSKFRKIYDYLLSNGQILKTGTKVTATLGRKVKSNIYKTKYSPIIDGESGLFLRVALYNNETAQKTYLKRNEFSVNPQEGVIEITSNTTIDSDIDVMADYAYLVESYSKDPIGGNELEDSATLSTNQYITRNMTDYVNGKRYSLRRFQPDQTKTDYYPIIEYIQTPEGHLIFSRDFFAYGDIPAEIHVEYETLGINPRLAVYSIRPSHTQTPLIHSISVGYSVANSSVGSL